MRRVGRRPDGDVRALEVARLGHPEVLDRLVGEVAEHRAHLGGPPDVELALDALGVGVERGGERALVLAELAQREVERLAAHALEQRLAGDLPAVQVGAGEQRVVVEHLLEVRDEPGAVDRVAGEAAADLVIHAAAGHPPQGVERHLALPAPEQELDRGAGRELRRGPEAAALGVVEPAERRHGRVQGGGVDLALRRLHRGGAAQALDDRARLPADLLALLVPGGADRQQHVAPARQPVARLGREIGAAPERHAVGGEEGVQRPAALAGHGLHRVHVDRVDIGVLLAVDLDADEALVHELRGLVVLEALALHHVAPVAGGVADRDEHGAVLLARPGERLVAPGVPVHGVLGVLEEVGGGLAGQSVGHG
jgi:hypothetical protein